MTIHTDILHDALGPVVTAVHSFVIGGGIGICGASDVIIASEDAYFSLPEIDRGAGRRFAPLAHDSAAQGARGVLYGRPHRRSTAK